MKFRVIIIFSYFLLALSFFSTKILAYKFPVDEAVPGGVIKINLDIPYIEDNNHTYPQAYFQDSKILVFVDNNSYHALVGLPLNLRPNTYSIKYTDMSGNNRYKEFEVKNKKYNISKIKIKNKNMVEPDQKTQQIIADDMKKIKLAVDNYSENAPVNLTLRQPVNGIPSTSFGARRIINGQPKNAHSGMDIAAAQNTPVFAASDGTVVLAGNFYLSGNMIAIDHGRGLITMYGHLNKILAKKGDYIKAGEKIGLVGSTGRVTGPHLHWTVKLNKTPVNPALFLDDGNHTET